MNEIQTVSAKVESKSRLKARPFQDPLLAAPAGIPPVPIYA